MATQIDHSFEVQATWCQLSSKPGDFLLKNFSDRETASPDDMWIVDQTLFLQTYEPVAPREWREILCETFSDHAAQQSKAAIKTRMRRVPVVKWISPLFPSLNEESRFWVPLAVDLGHQWHPAVDAVVPVVVAAKLRASHSRK